MRRDRSVFCSIFSLSFALSCAPLESDATRESPSLGVVALPEGTAVATKGESAGVITGAFDPNSTESQLLQASADSNIADVVLAFPPGSLAIATDISLKEGASIGSELLLQELGLATLPTVTNSAATVEITSSEAIDLKEPMILALPLPFGFGLTVDPTQRRRLGVLYRIQIQDTGEKLVGFVPASELTIDDNGKVLYPSRYFGSFQVVVFDQVVARVERKDTQPTKDLGGTSIHYQFQKISAVNSVATINRESGWDQYMNYCSVYPTTTVGLATAVAYTPNLTVVPPMEVRTE